MMDATLASELKPGDRVITTAAQDCLPEGLTRIVYEHGPGDTYIKCYHEEKIHYIGIHGNVPIGILWLRKKEGAKMRPDQEVLDMEYRK